MTNRGSSISLRIVGLGVGLGVVLGVGLGVTFFIFGLCVTPSEYDESLSSTISSSELSVFSSSSSSSSEIGVPNSTTTAGFVLALCVRFAGGALGVSAITSLGSEGRRERVRLLAGGFRALGAGSSGVTLFTGVTSSSFSELSGSGEPVLGANVDVPSALNVYVPLASVPPVSSANDPQLVRRTVTPEYPVALRQSVLSALKIDNRRTSLSRFHLPAGNSVSLNPLFANWMPLKIFAVRGSAIHFCHTKRGALLCQAGCGDSGRLRLAIVGV